MSIHIWKAQEKAARMGAYAGNTEAAELWSLSKRELIEIALRLGEICADDFSVDGAIARVKEEHRILREQGII